MALVSLRIAHVRCIEAAALALDPHRNFLFGPNGAGKTTVLEAIHVLGRGRSFRVRRNAALAQRGQTGFRITGDVEAERHRAHRLSIRFEAGRLEVQIDGAPGRRSSDLAALLPVHVLEPGMHSLISDGPSRRRRFLDWGVFHVEPSYLAAWRDYRRALGQRNAALKLGDVRQLPIWNERLVEVAARVDRARRGYFERWREQTLAIAKRLARLDLLIDLDPGGYSDRPLTEALRAGEERDRRIGLTHIGPHRADLKLRVGGQPVRDAASRGQQKLIAAALVLGQVATQTATSPGAGMLLVDDPAAELDQGGLERLLAELARWPMQMLVTGIARGPLEPLGQGRVFHVEQGVIRPQGV